MAGLRIYCPCKVREIGTATIDLYSIPLDVVEELLGGTALCRHCGQAVLSVGGVGALTEPEAARIDAAVRARGILKADARQLTEVNDDA